MPRSVRLSVEYMPEAMTRIENKLVDIEFAGWRSDTYQLQQKGWQISVNEDPASMCIQVALKHPIISMYGLTDRVNYMHLQEDAMARHSGITLRVIRMETDMKIIQPSMVYEEVRQPDMSGFVPVDARPSVRMQEQTHIDDYRIFRPMAKQSQIIVPKQNVDELLAKIHELQSPEQDRIREDKQNRLRRELHKCNQDANNYDISTNIVAQVATLI